MNKEKEKKGLPRTGIVILPTEDPTTLYQSNILSRASFDYSLQQNKILILVIEQLQKAICDSISGKNFEQLNLFSSKDPDTVTLPIAYKDLGVNSANYNLVKEALRLLSSIPVEYTIKLKDGTNAQKLTSLLSAIIPDQRYHQLFYIEVSKQIVEKVLINTINGYTSYMKEIAMHATSKYTLRLYLLISSWKALGGFEITLEKFRKFLKLEKKYLNFGDLNRRVIKPAYEELFEKSDIWFEVSTRNNPETKTPETLVFKIISAKDVENENTRKKSYIKEIEHACRIHFKMTEAKTKSVLKLVNDGNYVAFLETKATIMDYVHDPRNKVKNVANYALKAFLNLKEEKQPSKK